MIDYPPLPSAKVKNAPDNTSTSLYVHTVRKVCRDNLTLHVFHSKSSSPAYPLLSPVSATRPVIFLDLKAVEYPMKRKSLNPNVLKSYLFFCDVFVLRSTQFLRSPVFKLINS